MPSGLQGRRPSHPTDEGNRACSLGSSFLWSRKGLVTLLPAHGCAIWNAFDGVLGPGRRFLASQTVSTREG